MNPNVPVNETEGVVVVVVKKKMKNGRNFWWKPDSL